MKVTIARANPCMWYANRVGRSIEVNAYDETYFEFIGQSKLQRCNYIALPGQLVIEKHPRLLVLKCDTKNSNKDK